MGGRAVGEDKTVCVGLDTHKLKIAVAVAEPGRAGAVRFVGEIANQPDAVRRLIERLGTKHGRLRVVTRPARAATACTGGSPPLATTAWRWRPRWSRASPVIG